MSNDVLQKLRENRRTILLSEIGAYLHDLGKARREFIESHSVESPYSYKHTDPTILGQLKNLFSSIKVEICGKTSTLLDFYEKHHERDVNSVPEPVKLLHPRNHGYDGIDSGLDKGAKVKQKKNATFIATAFGYEEKRIEDPEALTEELYNLLENALAEYLENGDIKELRKKITKETKKFYLNFLGETRRPANDVTLWDHSYSVASLFKCAVAVNIIDCDKASFDPLEFRWKVLRVNLDVLSILSKGIKLGDVISYQDRIEEAFRRVKELIEVEYPLGNEIYRDTSGIYFLIPDVDLTVIDGLRKKLIEEVNEVEPELMATILVTSEKGPETSSEKLSSKGGRFEMEKEIKQLLKRLLPSSRGKAIVEITYPTSTERFPVNNFNFDWSDKEVCPICRLRPMEENSDGCEHCIGRRVKRAKKWIAEPVYTIWLDEVADHNDRIALITGSFDLRKWLDGTFIRTMIIDTNPESGKEPNKNPSPARIRRVWESTQHFIRETIGRILQDFPYAEGTQYSGLRRKRIELKIEPNPNVPVGATCDIEVEGIRFSPVCINKENSIFVSTINLQILGRFGNSAEEISSYLRGKSIKVNCGRGWKENYRISECHPADKEFQNYLPFVKIFDFPDQFMVLAPAYDVLEIAERIVREYEAQFSKVRDRLPLHLGIIAFHRKTPLYAVMEAGKTLVEAFRERSNTIGVEVIEPIKDVSAPDSSLGSKVKKVVLKPNSDYSHYLLEWFISYSTGDGQDDEWHPYFRFNGNPNREPYSFEYTNGNYVVHVKALQKGDQVKIKPSFFRLFYLDTLSSRFKVDEDLRPLDDIHRITSLWNKIQEQNWSMSQIHAFWQEVRKRYDGYKGDSTWENFVKAAISNILRLPHNSGFGEEIFKATKYGILDLCLNWYLTVKKVKPRKEVVV